MACEKGKTGKDRNEYEQIATAYTKGGVALGVIKKIALLYEIEIINVCKYIKGKWSCFEIERGVCVGVLLR